MLSSLFQSTTIPVLQEVISFTGQRHQVLASNIANLDVPGYQAKDLSVADFQQRLQSAIEAKNSAASESPGEFVSPAPQMPEVARSSELILRHDLNNVDMETQVSEMVKNQGDYETAITIMMDQFHQLQTAIRGTV
jgi:flagellar basal-body rod protein FlgB